MAREKLRSGEPAGISVLRTCAAFVRSHRAESEFPFLSKVDEICQQKAKPDTLTQMAVPRVRASKALKAGCDSTDTGVMSNRFKCPSSSVHGFRGFYKQRKRRVASSLDASRTPETPREEQLDIVETCPNQTGSHPHSHVSHDSFFRIISPNGVDLSQPLPMLTAWCVPTAILDRKFVLASLL